MTRALQWCNQLFLAFAVLLELVLALCSFAADTGSGVAAVIFGVMGIVLLNRFLQKEMTSATRVLGSVGQLFLLVFTQVGFNFLMSFIIQFVSR
ncbi:hypothetical protein [Hymenobacter swuensis]|uniref:hypothetical protein n=1 Tax=Hymenobacter swuensis TaxID=1446467 RepID=UPI0005C4A3FA|nr:hypothetical protein [Hymenobacter swuensis]